MKFGQWRCAPTLEMDREQNVFLGLLENISSNIYIDTKLLCLVEIVGSPVVNIVTECSRYHRKGIKICVVSSQLSGLLGKQTIFNIMTSLMVNNLMCGLKNTHLQKTEHGLAHIKPMPPVMVGDISVALSYGVHPSGQDLV